jgi:hypothetical protein
LSVGGLEAADQRCQTDASRDCRAYAHRCWEGTNRVPVDFVLQNAPGEPTELSRLRHNSKRG